MAPTFGNTSDRKYSLLIPVEKINPLMGSFELPQSYVPLSRGSSGPITQFCKKYFAGFFTGNAPRVHHSEDTVSVESSDGVGMARVYEHMFLDDQSFVFVLDELDFDMAKCVKDRDPQKFRFAQLFG